MRPEDKYTIDVDVPIPKKERPLPSNGKYPFTKLEVGDSFFVPYEDVKECKAPHRAVCAAASNWGRRHGRVLTTRTLRGEDGRIYGFRVWRLE